MNVENGAMYHVQTLGERAWRWLGFRYHLGDEPEGVEKMQGWLCTDSRIDFSLSDRLRLLLTGKLRMRLIQHTDVQIECSKNRFDWHILAPGER